MAAPREWPTSVTLEVEWVESAVWTAASTSGAALLKLVNSNHMWSQDAYILRLSDTKPTVYFQASGPGEHGSVQRCEEDIGIR